MSQKRAKKVFNLKQRRAEKVARKATSRYLASQLAYNEVVKTQREAALANLEAKITEKELLEIEVSE